MKIETLNCRKLGTKGKIILPDQKEKLVWYTKLVRIRILIEIQSWKKMKNRIE